MSGNTFVALDATPAIGRFFTPDDDVAGAAPVVVLTDAYWTRRFNRSPTVVGQSVVVNATPMTIIGVARPDFAGMVANQRPAFFTPITLRPFITPTVNDVEDRRSRWLHIVGRLAPGATMARAKAALDVRYRQIHDGELTSEPALAALSERFKENFRKKSLDIFDASHGISQVRGALGAPMSMLMAMVGLVLLIACANVANLMLARATGRQREMSVRLALGANRGRLIRQTLVESAVVAVLGGLVGTVMAIWLGDLLLGVLPLDAVDTSLSTTPDGRVALFTCAVTALTVLLFGLAPAVRGSAVDLNRALKEESAAAGGGLQHAHLRKSLVVAQVALSTLLVAGAALFARSLANLETLGPGFDTAHVVTFAVDATLTGRTQVQAKQLYRALGKQLGDLPGVTAVSMAAEAVLTNNASQRTVQVQGYEPGQDENMNPWTNDVGPAYFTALGIPVLAGRQFTERDVDGAPRVAVVNESFAKYYFGTESPLGHRFGFRSEDDPGRWEIVGVVQDTAYSQVRPGEAASLAELAPGRGLPDTTMPRVIYTPYQQSQDVDELTFYLRTTAAAALGVPALARQAVHRADATLPVYRMTTLEATVDSSLAVERLLALLSVLFGVLATLLAAVGLYGVMSYTVARRTREIGIRIALGADRSEVVAMVLREVALLTGLGIAVGLPGAYAIGRAAESQLFGLSPLDPVSLVGAAVVLALVGVLAGYLPARRAAATEPLVALRTE